MYCPFLHHIEKFIDRPVTGSFQRYFLHYYFPFHRKEKAPTYIAWMGFNTRFTCLSFDNYSHWLVYGSSSRKYRRDKPQPIFLTMDLLAAFFFSSTIVHILKNKESKEGYFTITFQASIIGTALLAAIYVGFSYIASFHGHGLEIGSKEELLSAITLKIAGPYAGLLVCIAIALACLTTAIALISSFTDFIHREVFKERVSYEITLIGGLLITFFVSTFNFTGISLFLWPILKICYPALIALTFLNIAHSLIGFKSLKLPVWATFGGSAVGYFTEVLL